MHHNGARNIALLTGFLATTAQANVRWLYQSAAMDSYIPVIVPPNCDVADLAPMDLSGPIVPFETGFAIRADYLEAATAQSIAPAASFHRLGERWMETASLIFRPAERSKLKPEVLAQLRDGTSNWGLSSLDAMATWGEGTIIEPSKKKLMNRVMINGTAGNLSNRAAAGEKYYCTTRLKAAPDGTTIDTRLYSDMRFGQIIRSAIRATLSPLRVTGSFHSRAVGESGELHCHLKAVEVFIAPSEDFPGPVPDWLRSKPQSAAA